MLSSTSGEEEEETPFCSNNHRPKNLCRISSSSSSSSPPFSAIDYTCIHHQISNTNKPRTMEEVWKDINLASLNGDHSSADQNPSLTPALHSPPPPYHYHHHSNSDFILQDFFSRPFRRDPPTRILSSAITTTTTSARSTSKSHGDHNNNTDGSLAPATILSLNSGAPGFDFLGNSEDLVIDGSHLQSHNSTSNAFSFITSFDGLDSSSGLASLGKRRAQDSDHSSPRDRRHKRMIKNRESAARSRARKQAYTHQLEVAIDQLNAENARLKREQEELHLAAAYQLPGKHTLHRTSTAPF